MTDEAAYHEGYRKALVEISRMVSGLRDGHVAELGALLETIDGMIERARCLSRSRLASTAVGDRGY